VAAAVARGARAVAKLGDVAGTAESAQLLA